MHLISKSEHVDPPTAPPPPLFWPLSQYLVLRYCIASYKNNCTWEHFGHERP